MTTSQHTTEPPDALTLSLLGVPDVRRGEQSWHPRTRKTLALLAYLALEPQAQSRERLAALFWPDVEVTPGRASLRTALAQLGALLNTRRAVLHTERDHVLVHAHHLNVDVHRLSAAARDPRASQETLTTAAALYRGDLLTGVDFPELPQYSDWLCARREDTHRDLDQILGRLARHQAQAGHVTAAVATTTRRLRHDPCNEDAYAQLIELHLNAGHRAAALTAYRQCRDVLERELGVTPGPDIQRLVGTLHPPREQAAQPNPLEGRPTNAVHLVGRDAAWTQLERAWARGQVIFVTGDAGVGKTRLLHDFARATAHTCLFRQARPGELGVPFASSVQTLRLLFSARPETRDRLPRWVTRELTRLLPELGEAPDRPLRRQADTVRLQEALREAARLACSDVSALVVDDLQSFDSASLDALLFELGRPDPQASAANACRCLYSYRTGELPGHVERHLRVLADQEVVAVVELSGLEPQDVTDLLTQVVLDDDPAADASSLHGAGVALHHFSGGNPMFVLETLRALKAQGRLSSLTSERFERRRRALHFPRTPSVTTIIATRLGGLSEPALMLARVAAVLDQQFSFERAGRILAWTVPSLSAAAAELERAHVWQGAWFAHDLLHETVLAVLPASSRMLLHGEALALLRDETVPAAVLAIHARLAGRVGEAARYAVVAGLDAYRLHALTLATDWFEQVRTLLRDPGSEPSVAAALSDRERFELYRALHRSYWESGLNRPAREQEVLEELFAWAPHVKDDAVRREIQYEHADREAVMTGDARWMRALLAEWLGAAVHAADAVEEVRVLREQALMEWALARFEDARQASRRALSVARRLGDDRLTGPVTGELAYHTSSGGHWTDAEALFVDALRRTPAESTFDRTEIMWTHAVNQIHLGHAREAAITLRRAVASWAALEDHVRGLHARVALGVAAAELGEFGEAETLARACGEDSLDTQWLGFTLLSTVALLWWQLGQVDEARRAVKMAERQVVRPLGFAGLTGCRTASLTCAFAAVERRWPEAGRAARLALDARQALGWERFEWSVLLPRWTETEALLRTGHVLLAREDVTRLHAAAVGVPRLRAVSLRCQAVVDLWDGHAARAEEALTEALRVCEALGVSGARWSLLVTLAAVQGELGMPQAAVTRNEARAVVNDLVGRLSRQEQRDLLRAHGERLGRQVVELMRAQGPTRRLTGVDTDF